MPDNVTPLWIFDCNPDDRYGKRQEVNSAAISDDGNLVVAGTFYHDYSSSQHGPRDPATYDFFIYCFERNQTDPGNPQPKYKWKLSSQEGFYWVDISGDGSIVAGGGSNFVVAYRTSDGAQVLSASTKSRVNQLVLSKDGIFLAAASDELYIFRYDAERFHAEPAAFEVPNAVYSVSMSSNGNRIVFSDYGPSDQDGAKAGVYFFDIDEDIRTYTEMESYAHCVKLSREGKYFASGGALAGETSADRVFLFESDRFVKTGKPLWTQQLPGLVYNQFVDDQGRVAAVCNDGAEFGFVTLFDKSGQTLWQKRVERNPNSTTISGSYVTVATGHPQNTPSYFYLLNIETGETIWRYKVTQDMSWPMAISHDGTGIVAGSDNQQIFYFQP